MPNGDIRPTRWRIREILGDFVLKSDFAVLDQHHHRCGRKLFTHGTGLEDGLLFDRNLRLYVGDAIPFRQYDAPAFHDCQRKSGDLLRTHFALDVRINPDLDGLLPAAKLGGQQNRPNERDKRAMNHPYIGLRKVTDLFQTKSYQSRTALGLAFGDYEADLSSNGSGG